MNFYKPESERSRSHEPRIDRQYIEEVDPESPEELSGFDLPTGGLYPTWHDATVRWWDAWRRSSQAQLFTSMDWETLLTTARLHTEYWKGAYVNETTRVAALRELRARESQLGANVADRAKLNIQKKPGRKGVAPSAAGQVVSSGAGVNAAGVNYADLVSG